MSTRSTIGKLNADGSVTSIYCHYDGYPEGVGLHPRAEGVGATLTNHYTSTSKVDQLLTLGDLSVLKPEIGESHDFEDPTEGWTIAYGRDRGDDDIEALNDGSVREWMTTRTQQGCEYGYLWLGFSWQVFSLYN